MTIPTVTLGPFVAGEKPAPLEYSFLDAAGVALDVVGTVVAKFQWVRQYSDDEPEVADAAYSSLTKKTTYTWTGDEMAASGQYEAELWIGNGTNRYASLKIEYAVRDAIGDPPSI